MKMQKQSGFTLIELVVVILILGILAATALPKFVSVENEAHQGAHQGVLGAYQAAVMLVHAKWIATGKPSAATNDLDINGDGDTTDTDDLTVNAAGWPIERTSGDDSANPSAQDCEELFISMLQQNAPTIGGGAAAYNGEDYNVTANTSVCTYNYRKGGIPDGDLTIDYDSATGSITKDIVIDGA